MLSSKQKIIATAIAKNYLCTPEWVPNPHSYFSAPPGEIPTEGFRVPNPHWRMYLRKMNAEASFVVIADNCDKAIQLINELPDADSQ